MKLRPEFETVRGSLLNRDPVPPLNEEQRLITLKGLVHETGISEVITYGAERKTSDKIGPCFKCHEFGHLARTSHNKSCNYCKELGHIIKDCPTCPQNCRPQSLQTNVVDFPPDHLLLHWR